MLYLFTGNFKELLHSAGICCESQFIAIILINALLKHLSSRIYEYERRESGPFILPISFSGLLPSVPTNDHAHAHASVIECNMRSNIHNSFAFACALAFTFGPTKSALLIYLCRMHSVDSASVCHDNCLLIGNAKDPIKWLIANNDFLRLMFTK